MEQNKYQNIFNSNKKWAENKLSINSNFFEELSKKQNPEFLYIGCSDSRVPAHLITGMDVGELFLHKNVANQIKDDDLNTLSVIYFAIKELKVKHIIICGHYGCGGVNAVCDGSPLPHPLDKWLKEVSNIKKENNDILNSIPDLIDKQKKLTQLNLLKQCENVENLPVVKESIAESNYPKVHGWIYNIFNGELIDMNWNNKK